MKPYSKGRVRRSLFHTVFFRALSQLATVGSYVVLVRGMTEQAFGVLNLLYAAHSSDQHRCISWNRTDHAPLSAGVFAVRQRPRSGVAAAHRCLHALRDQLDSPRGHLAPMAMDCTHLSPAALSRRIHAFQSARPAAFSGEHSANLVVLSHAAGLQRRNDCCAFRGKAARLSRARSISTSSRLRTRYWPIRWAMD